MYVQRNAQNVIIGVYHQCQDGFATEELQESHPDIVAFHASRIRDNSDIEQLDKAIKSLGLLLREYTNALQAGTHSTKTVTQLKADFKAWWDSLV